MKKDLLALLPVLFLLPACDGEPLEVTTSGGGGSGTAFSVLIVDDPDLDSPTTGGSASAIDGVFEGRVRVALRNQFGTFVELGSSENVEIELQDGDAGERVFTTARPPTGTYNAIEITLENATVLVRAGSTIGGTVVENDELLDLGSTGVVVLEGGLQPTIIDDDSRLALVIDLNAENWVTVDNLDAALVDDTDLAAAVSVGIE